MSTTSGSRDYGRFDELAEEFAGRYRRGERPSLQEYVNRLPEMAEEIREMFPAMVEVERADGDVRGELVPPSPKAFPHAGQIGDYRILREVGRGGMGVVYEAEQVSLGRRVALKVLPGHVTGDRQALERFRREAKSAARLHHTNIVPVFEVGRDRDVSFYAMQLIQGQGLDQVFEELRRLREPGAMANGHDLARSKNREGVAADEPSQASATSVLQEQALVQMTANLLTGRLVAEGPKVSMSGAIAATGLAQTEQLDFAATSDLRAEAPSRELPTAPTASGVSSAAMMPGGKHVSEVDTSGRRQPFFRSVAQIGRQTAQGLAYAHARGIVHRDIKPSNLLLDTEGVVWITDFGLAKADDDGMTASGDILGTLRYMAPERFRGEGDARADIYALGLTLYEILTLRPAYDSTDRLRLIERIKNEEPVRPRLIDPQIPRDLETVVLKAIDKHPDHRYPTAAALAEDLRRFLADEPIKARQIGTSERYWRWARRNPVVATLGAVLTALMVIATIGSLFAAAQFSELADQKGLIALSEKSARERSDLMTKEAQKERVEAEKERAEAERARYAESRQTQRAESALLDSLGQTYRATRSEVRALRLAHESGWRSASLERIGGLVRLGSRNLNRQELREDAIASLAEMDVRIRSRIAPTRDLGVWYLKFSPDGRTLAMNNKLRGGVSLWDHAQDRELDTIPKAFEYSPFAFHPGGALAVASAPGRVTFHPLAPGQPAFPAIEGQGHALNLAFSGSGDRVAIAWEEVYLPSPGSPRELQRITVYETANGREIRTIAIPKGSSVSYKVPLALSPDGNSVATTGPNFEVRVYPVGNAGDLVVLGTLDTYVCVIAFHPDGRSLAASGKRFAAIWDIASRSERVRIIQSSDRGIWDLAYSPDGRSLATVSDDAVGRLWDARSGRELAAVPAETKIGLSLAFSPRGDCFAVGAASASVLGIEGGRERRTELSQTNFSSDLVFDPVQPRLYHTGGDRKIYEWKLDEAAARPTSFPPGLSPSVLRLAPGGREFVVGWHPYNDTKPGADYSIAIWARDNLSAERRLIGPRKAVDSMALDKTGRRIAAGSDDGGLYVWDFRGGTLLYRKELGAIAPSLQFLDDSGLLVAAGSRLLLLSAEDGSVRLERTLPQTAAAFVVTPDRKEALVATVDGTIHKVLLPGLEIQRSQRVLDADSWRRMAISPEGSLLAVTTRKWTRALLLDSATLEPVVLMPGLESGSLRCLAFDPKGRYFAFGSVHIALWDLALIRDELAPLGLAWGQAASPPISTPVPAEAVGRVDLAEVESKPQGLLQSGVSALRERRFQDAIVDLEQVSERLQALRQSRPDRSELASQHGFCLGCLSVALRSLNRPVEALAREKEGLAAYESLKAPNPIDSFNMALACGRLSADLAPGSAEERENLDARAERYLRRAVEGNPGRYLALVIQNGNFNRLRERADFRGLIADLRFPRDPFAEPSPISISQITPGERKIRGEALIAGGRTLDAIPYLASAWEGNPQDSMLLLRVAALQAWFHRDAELATLGRKARELARGTRDPDTADSAAKSSSLRPLDDPKDRAATLDLARMALELGKDSGNVGWYRMGLGLAEYRSGNDEAAGETLRPLLVDGAWQIPVTSAFYLAMSLSRQGKDAEARQVATVAISRMKPLPLDDNNPLAGSANHDDLILWVAYKEARALLKLDSAPSSKEEPKGK